MVRRALHAILAVASAIAVPAQCTAAPWTPIEQPDLLQKIRAAAPLTVESVCSPVRTAFRGLLLTVPNPDHATHDLLQIYMRDYGGPNTIVIMDGATHAMKQIALPRDLNLHLCPTAMASNGRLFISALDLHLRQQLCVYDPATDTLTTRAVALPAELLGETHPLVVSTDNMIVMAGSHPSQAVTAVKINPATLQVTAYGPMGPSHSPNGCWAYSAAADDRYIYIASGKVPWYLVAYDTVTAKSEVLLETGPVNGDISVGQGRFGCTANASGLVGTDGKRRAYWLWHGKAIVKLAPNEKPPWPETGGVDLPSTPKPDIDDTLADVDPHGYGEIRYRSAQDHTAGRDWTVFRYQVPTYPSAITRLTELPDGRLIGTADAYTGHFLFDPATNTAVHPGKDGLSHYSTAILKGLVYMSGYPNSPLYVYDPNRPWTANTVRRTGVLVAETDPDANPRLLLRMNTFAGTHKMYAAAVGADGRVYFGGRWYRNGSAGGLAWYDPAARQAGGFWETLSNYQVNFMTTVDSGRYVVISTHRIADPLLGKPKPAQGRLFFFDTRTHQITATLDPVDNAKGAGLVAGIGGARLLGWTDNPAQPGTSILYGAEIRKGEPRVVFQRILPILLPVTIGSNQMEPFDFRMGPDHRLWTFAGPVLLTIDTNTTEIRVVGKVPSGGRMAFSDHDLYLAGSTELRRIRGITSTP